MYLDPSLVTFPGTSLNLVEYFEVESPRSRSVACNSPPFKLSGDAARELSCRPSAMSPKDSLTQTHNFLTYYNVFYRHPRNCQFQ